METWQSIGLVLELAESAIAGRGERVTAPKLAEALTRWWPDAPDALAIARAWRTFRRKAEAATPHLATLAALKSMPDHAPIN